MEHPYLFFVTIFEMLHLGDWAHANSHVIYSWVIMAFLLGVGYICTRKIHLIPTGAQNVMEVIIIAIEDFMIDNTGEEGRFLFPLAATIFIYILVSNLVGLVPGFFPPTANINTTLSCALVVFFSTHLIGIKFHGVSYVKHFMGPVWWMAPLVAPIEVVGHFARVLSLTFRLFGNMMGHEIVLAILFMLAGLYLAPLPIMALGIFVAFVQAFVFFLLTIIYFSGAMEHAH